MSLTELAIKRPSFIIVIFLALGLLAVFGYFQLGYELLPKIESPYVTVETVYPGASPSEVENNVTRIIEDGLSGIEKLKNMSSYSYEGLSFVVLEFYRSASVNIAVQDVQRKVNEVLSQLPKDAKTPSLLTYSVSQMPVLRLSLTSKLSPSKFYTLVDDQIKPRLSRVPGVGNITITGGMKREIRINVDAQKARSYGLSVSQVSNSVYTANLDFPTGKLMDPKYQLVVRVAGKFTSLEEMKNLVVGRSSQGGEIMLKDVAEVEDGTADPTRISRFNGINALGLEMQKQNDANMVQVCGAVLQELSRLESDYKDIGLHFDIADNQSVYTMQAARAVMEDLGLAILLVALVMFLFLHSVRTSLIVMVSIPCSLTTAFVVMWIFGMSLNLFTLLALSLVIGILVDDSIVVLENIYHHLEKGEERAVAALKGRTEIGFAAVSITFVDIVVFVPLALTAGLIGDIVRGFSIIILVSTLTSLLVSFTVTPILASRFARLENNDSRSLLSRFGKVFEQAFNWITREYGRLLGWCLNRPNQVLYGVTAALVITLLIPVAGLTGFEFMKQTDRSQVSVGIEYAPGTTLESNNRQTQEIERRIATLPEVISILTNVGKGGDGVSTDNQSEIVVSFCPKEDRSLSTAQLGQKIKEMTSTIPGVKVFINQIDFTGGTSGAPVVVEITGVNLDSIMKTSAIVARNLLLTPGVTYLKFSATKGNPETRVEIDRQKMAALGLTVGDVGTTLQVALTGNNESKYREGSNQYDIRVSLDKFDRTNPDNIAHLSFINPKREMVELQQFATIYQSSGPTKLERKNRNAMTTVSAYTDGSPAGSIVQSFASRLGDRIAGGTRIKFGGDQDEMATSFLSLLIALVAGILFVYFIMVILYDSFAYPFVVLFSIPVALIGAILALALTRNTINVFSILGLIMMVGLVAKNAILIVDRANERRAAGESIREALMDAGKMRIRPIFMTTFAMIFGMLPIATAAGAGAEWKNGLAWVLIGGLTSSMFLTLIVVPIVYEKVARLLTPKHDRDKKNTPVKPPVPPVAILLLLLLFTGIHSSSAQQAFTFKTTRIKVAVVYDGPAHVNREFEQRIEQEVKGLMSGQVTVDFMDPGLTTGNWTESGAEAINNKLLADKSVDMIVSMGVISSQDLTHRKALPKPVIAAGVINHELQRIPWVNGASGVPNLAYIQLKSSIENEITELEKIVPFHNLSLVASRDYYDVINPDHRQDYYYDTVAGVKVHLILADTSADEILAAIPEHAEAVYLDALFRMPPHEMARLVDSLNARKIPSFGYDESLVREGFLASVFPRFMGRLSKRIALDMQQILLGSNASTLPVDLLQGTGFYLNLGTFGKLGLRFLSWDLITEATIVDFDRQDSTAKFISLPDLMDLALDSNQDLVARKFELLASSEDINIARSVLLPYLNLSATGTLNSAVNGSLPLGVAGTANASQIIYSEPYWSDLRVAQTRQQARVESYQKNELDIGNEVAKAYMNIIESRSNFYLLIHNLMIARSNLDVAKMKKETGSAGEDEILRWQIEVARAKRNVIATYSTMVQDIYQLVQLIHVKTLTTYDLAEFRLDKSGLLIADSAYLGILDDPIRLHQLGDFLVQEGIAHSPVLGQYDFLIGAQERYYRSANISRYIPVASAFGNYNQNLYSLNNTANDLLYNAHNYYWQAGVRVEIPLFTGLKNNAIAQQARLTVAQLKSDRQSNVDKLESYILSALSNLMAAYYDYRQMKIAEAAATRNFDIVNNQYLLGQKNILDVLDAQTQSLSTSMAVNTAFANFVRNYFDLQQALGRFDYRMTPAEKADFMKRLTEHMTR
ncbi:MAG TPA: efflux RND transporter permease subunit [Bacteroidales bacterium]|nr:efflux RND transporter permease subunit [Bacteroidales bacterium]